nr:hypothetical protein GCM10017611_78870 [Rhodococcus wratislaviensis]
MRLRTNGVNRTEYHCGAATSPSPSPMPAARPAGLIRAIAATIRTGLARGDDPAASKERTRCAEAAGLPLTLW